MGSVLAIVSKAMFEREMKRAKEAADLHFCDVLDIDRYISRGPGLAPLRDGGSLVLVTVRRDAETGSESVWLVAILEDPSLTDDGYVADSPNMTPLTDVTALMLEYLAATNKGKVPAAGRLAMSLQTPRSLREEWLKRFLAVAKIRNRKKKPAKKRQRQQTREEPRQATMTTTATTTATTTRTSTLAAPSLRARSIRMNAASLPVRVEWPRHARDLALGLARLRKCQHWRDATARDVDAALAQPGRLTGIARVCFGVLSTLPKEDALATAARAARSASTFASFCYQTALLEPALARLGGEAIGPLIARAVMSGTDRRRVAFKMLAYVGTPVALPVVLDIMTRAPTYRRRARLWIAKYADVLLPVLIPLAAGATAEALGLADFAPQKTAAPLRKAAVRALQLVTSSEAILACARAAHLENETIEVLASRSRRPEWAPASLGDASASELERDLDVESLLTKWIKARAPRNERWIVDAACQLREGALTSRVVDLIRSWRSTYRTSAKVPIEAIARSAVEQLGHPASDRAFEALGALMMKGGGHGATVKKAIDDVSEMLDLSRETLSDRLVPRLGLDSPRGVIHFNVAKRKLEARLDATLSPYILDLETNQHLSEFPRVTRRGMRAMKSDDEREAQRWDLFRKETKLLAPSLANRAETWIRDRTRWSVDDFKAHVVGHPILRHIAFGLVWGVYAPNGGSVETFRVSEDLSFASIADESFSLAFSKRRANVVSGAFEVGAIHPAELDDKQIARWADLLFDYQIVPLVSQLSWPVIRLSKAEQDSTELDPRPYMTHEALNGNDVARLWQRKWQEGPPLGGGTGVGMGMGIPPAPGTPIPLIAYEKRVSRVRSGDPLRVVMTLANNVTTAFTRSILNLRVQSFAAVGFDGWLPWSEVDPVSASEMLVELSQLNGR